MPPPAPKQGAVSKDPQLSHLPGLSQYQQHAAALTGHFVGKKDTAEDLANPF